MKTGDPELDKVIAELQSVFRARTAEEIPVIESHWAALQNGAEPRIHAEALRAIIHRMGGSAGSFGFPAVSDAALPLEGAISMALKGTDEELARAIPGWMPLIEGLLAACRAL